MNIQLSNYTNSMASEGKRKRGRPKKYLGDRSRKYQKEWEKKYAWVTASRNGVDAYCKVCHLDISPHRHHVHEHGQSSSHQKLCERVSLESCHLDFSEQALLCERIYESMFGALVYAKWKEIKKWVGFSREMDFVNWLLETAEEALNRDEEGRGNLSADDDDDGDDEEYSIRLQNNDGTSTTVVASMKGKKRGHSHDKEVETRKRRPRAGGVLGRKLDKILACKYCRRVFPTKDEVMTHIHSKHGSSGRESVEGQTSGSEAKVKAKQDMQYQCSLCMADFRYRKSAHKHFLLCSQQFSETSGRVMVKKGDGEWEEDDGGDVVVAEKGKSKLSQEGEGEKTVILDEDYPEETRIEHPVEVVEESSIPGSSPEKDLNSSRIVDELMQDLLAPQ